MYALPVSKYLEMGDNNGWPMSSFQYVLARRAFEF
jgi:hypothetical protein